MLQGDYEEASYHELLESIQTHDLTPLAERHHALVMKSYVEPQLKQKLDVQTTLNWLPLDTPTAEELAQTNLTKAQTAVALIGVGALSSEDERQRIATDKQSGYNELGILDEDPDNFEDPDEGDEPEDEPDEKKPEPSESASTESPSNKVTDVMDHLDHKETKRFAYIQSKIKEGKSLSQSEQLDYDRFKK